MIGYRSCRLCDRDIRDDISMHEITLQVLAPGFWKILLSTSNHVPRMFYYKVMTSLMVIIVVIICLAIIVTFTARVNHY